MRWAPLSATSERRRLLPPTSSQRYWAAVATQFLTETLPSNANQLPSQSPSFKTTRPISHFPAAPGGQ